MDVEWTPVVGATKYEVSVTLTKNAAPYLVIEDAVQPVLLTREPRQFIAMFFLTTKNCLIFGKL